ncbi:MAG: TraB/GumN family protein [Erythrobacter sp.]
MPRLAGIFASVCILFLAACSGGEPAPEDVIQSADGQPNPPFYEITNRLGRVEGWILGTIHALPDGTSWRTAPIDDAIRDADRVLVEVADLGSGSNIAEIFNDLSTTHNMGPLVDRVDPGLAEQLMAMAEKSGVSEDTFNNTETWGAALLLARVDAVGKPRNGVDRYVLSRFEDRPTYGFELARTQLGIFDGLAEEDQRALLEGTIEEWSASRDNRGHLIRAWLDGDVAALEAATITGIMVDPELRDALLVARNNTWFPVILTHLEDSGKPLIAVGAAHLLGPDGLTVMLEEEGYTVRRID